MNPQQMISYSEQMVELLVKHAEIHGIAHTDMLKGIMIANILLKASCPCRAKMFALMQEAEGDLAMMYLPPGLPC